MADACPTTLLVAELASEIARRVSMPAGIKAIACAFAAEDGARSRDDIAAVAAAYLGVAAVHAAHEIGIPREALLATMRETYDLADQRFS